VRSQLRKEWAMKRSDPSDFRYFDTGAAALPDSSSVAARLTSMDGIECSAMEDWLRIHRRLVELEVEFSDDAMRAAAGEISLNELQEKRKHLMGMRDLCSAVYEKAFGGARRP
jgi:hypothetical protein